MSHVGVFIYYFVFPLKKNKQNDSKPFSKWFFKNKNESHLFSGKRKLSQNAVSTVFIVIIRKPFFLIFFQPNIVLRAFFSSHTLIFNSLVSVDFILLVLCLMFDWRFVVLVCSSTRLVVRSKV